MTDVFEIREEARGALANGKAIVALESTVIAHGLPHPLNIETARAMEAAVRESRAVPATIGILDGRVIVGLTAKEIERLAQAKDVVKVSRADLAAVMAGKRTGATTVASTMLIAAKAGIRTFATGGIGGVHRGVEYSMDVSADLTELGRTQVAVVCAGAKAILDLQRTLEVLETLGVPVIGFRTKEFPAFYCRESGLELLHWVATPEEAAEIMKVQWEIRGADMGGILIVNPPPAESALPRQMIETFIGKALEEAARKGIKGKEATPFLLREVGRLSEGKTLEANVDLLVSNARLAGLIAAAYSASR
ncbi:MAG TPA: pseudouridine-5'-phosphate glycosidase [Candidatus Eremiobacteraceae bacterium]|nr:pseudouridine-5'-phosphate glycosidase [Candidatus Eremiobacteraceae bacterium]